jgi:hypothetical protein
MTQTIYTDRSRYQAYGRCKRLRYLEYHAGEVGVGLTPKRRSIHLVVGSAVHAGLEVLLRDGQYALDHLSGDNSFQALFEIPDPSSNHTVARQIENRAVTAALTDLRKEMNDGVELDPEEQAAQQAALASQAAELGMAAPATEVDMGGLVAGMSSNSRQEVDSPIVISFDNLVPTTIDPASVVIGLPDPLTPQTSMGAVRVTSGFQSNEDYLKEEISALVEGMVRCWSRRRWRSTLEQFEILETEREGIWKLAEHRPFQMDVFTTDPKEPFHTVVGDEGFDLYFLSRHDALLLERSTGYLYLQSFKTTGSWDRRKEMDAQVDMQGLSEAVDVEKRFGEAWALLSDMKPLEENGDPRDINDPEYLDASQRVRELVSDRVAHWLRSLPDPPQILGVRYEYLLKGSRKRDKKDAIQPDRYVQESILCRAWKQEGITSDDRRWAWTYDWNDETGKGRRLDYRSWQKAPVWKSVPIADWIDLLDQGKVQEGALREDGEPMDALAEQFVPVLTVYRNSDEMLDLLEQLESQEVQIARDVATVKEAEAREGYAGKRTALNRLFPQTRTACSYPGVCQYRTTSSQPGFCFGAADPFHDQTVLDRFIARVPNHPKENQTLVQICVDERGIKE